MEQRIETLVANNIEWDKEVTKRAEQRIYASINVDAEMAELQDEQQRVLVDAFGPDIGNQIAIKMLFRGGVLGEN